MKVRSFPLFACLALCLSVAAQAQKKPLGPEAFDIWKSVAAPKLSNDGAWLQYRITPQDGDAVGHLRNVAGGSEIVIDRASLVFSNDSKYAVGLVVPKQEDVKKARAEKKKPEDMPKNSLLIVNLATGEKTEIKDVTSYSIAPEDSGWILYKPEPPKAAPAPKAPEAKPEEKKPEEKKEEPKKDEPKKKADHKPGDTWVLRNLATGKEEKLENVVTTRWSKDGGVLVYVLSTKDGAGDGVVYDDLKAGKKTTVMQAMGKYPKLAVHDDTKQVAFVTDKDDYAAKKPSLSLYVFEPKSGKTRLLAKDGTAGIPSGWIITERGTLGFSEKGKRVIFATIPKPAEEKKDDTPEEDKVSVDIWNWQDETLQPQQLLQAQIEANRSYDAVAFLDSGRILQLENETFQSVNIADQQDGDIAIAQVDKAYRREQSWGVNEQDYYLIDLKTGKSRALATKTEDSLSLSPKGKYLVGIDPAKPEIYAIDVASGKRVSLTAKLPYPFTEELNDVPDYAGAYGVEGWTEGDKLMLMYDRFDMWAVDPTGKADPVCVTNGYGRRTNIRLRRQNLDPDEKFVNIDKPMFLTGFDENTMAQGFFTDDLQGSPKALLTDKKRFTYVGKAKGSDRVVYTRQDFIEYPDVWVASDLTFKDGAKVTDANPQQKDYWWGTSELVEYTSNDGVKLRGLIIKPEDFDYRKKYPMIAYFYERDSETLMQYRTPAPSASVINPSIYASNGYVVFIPDIAYKIGYPGESAISAIIPGCQEVIRKGYIDPKRVGIQGQSWGGYQVAYMVTETNMFAAACAGAPVSDMFSAYGGIRWGSGLVRQFQYEKTQSRIGGTPWNSTLRFLENSPVFYADKVQTPLLIMHNDKDGSVPWWQSIEYFTALRRLNKPAWMCVYNGEDHNLIQRKNRKDWSMRMQQFFDHFLKGAPEPVWMATGVPATQKGKTYGFEIPPKAGEKKGGG